MGSVRFENNGERQFGVDNHEINQWTIWSGQFQHLCDSFMSIGLGLCECSVSSDSVALLNQIIQNLWQSFIDGIYV